MQERSFARPRRSSIDTSQQRLPCSPNVVHRPCFLTSRLCSTTIAAPVCPPSTVSRQTEVSSAALATSASHGPHDSSFLHHLANVSPPRFTLSLQRQRSTAAVNVARLRTSQPRLSSSTPQSSTPPLSHAATLRPQRNCGIPKQWRLP